MLCVLEIWNRENCIFAMMVENYVREAGHKCRKAVLTRPLLDQKISHIGFQYITGS